MSLMHALDGMGERGEGGGRRRGGKRGGANSLPNRLTSGFGHVRHHASLALSSARRRDTLAFLYSPVHTIHLHSPLFPFIPFIFDYLYFLSSCLLIFLFPFLRSFSQNDPFSFFTFVLYRVLCYTIAALCASLPACVFTRAVCFLLSLLFHFFPVRF